MNTRHYTRPCLVPFFFFNDTATTEIYTLSLHDALPISEGCLRQPGLLEGRGADRCRGVSAGAGEHRPDDRNSAAGAHPTGNERAWPRLQRQLSASGGWGLVPLWFRRGVLGAGAV